MMLQSFRRAKSTWYVGGILGIVMLAFMLSGIERRSPGPTAEADWVAKVGSETITVNDLNQEVDRQLSRMRQEQPETKVDRASLVNSGAFDQILASLISAKAMRVFGAEQGIVVSDQMINREIASAPVFQNVAGQFEDMRLRQWLATQKVSERELRADLATELMQRQLIPPVGASPRAPEALANRYAALLMESRTGSIGAVPASAISAGPPPSDAELATYFKSHSSRYTIPERRVLRYAPFGVTNVAASAKATEAEIAEAYKAKAAQYAPRETRTLSQVVLPSQKAAQEFVAKVAGGTSFAKAAADAGFAPTDTAIGKFTREEFAKGFPAAVADAAFAAPAGGLTAPVKSPLGWHIIRVDAIATSAGRPLAAVRTDLAKEVEEGKIRDALLDLSAKIEDEISNGASFEEVARAHGLAIVETPPVTAQGQAPGVAGFQLPAEATPLLKGAFELTPEDDPIVTTIAPNQRLAIVTIGQIEPAAPPPFATVKERVTTDLLAERADAKAKAVANAIVAKMNAGTPMREAFASAGVALPPVQTATLTRMQMAQQGAQVPAPVKAVFSLAAGKTRLLPAPNGGGWFIVHTDKIVPADVGASPGLAEATRAQLAAVMGDEYIEQFAHALEREVEVKRNEAVIARLKSEIGQSKVE
jgi:peptidyl-prolyl cis-trans isomerase D